jgi:hypothetical protein
MDIFTARHWRAAGRSMRSLERGLEAGAVRKVLHGVYAWAEVSDTPETRARAIRLVRPSQTVVGRTMAAWMSKIDVIPPGASIADERIHLLVAKGVTPPRLPGCTSSQADLPESDLVEEYGVLRTSDTRTALDLARFAPRPQAVASVDAFLNGRRVALPELWTRARLLTRVRNCRRLRANLAAADSGAQSYAESVERVLFLDAGLPRPTTQIPVHGPTGELLGYLDMGWLRYLLASEYDGEEYHDGDEDRAADERRRGRIEDETAWTIDVARKGDLWGRPAGLVARTAELLLARGWVPNSPLVLEQISRAAQFEAQTGQKWQWMSLERLRAS